MFKSVQLFQQIHRRSFATKIKKSVLLQNVDKIHEFEYPRSSESDRRIYVWGLAETGALGVQKNLRKHSKTHTAIIRHPSRLQFSETIDIIDVACGYGFSAFAVKRKDNFSLFGTGINTDTQIGYHKHGGKTNKPLELLIYPAPIHLPHSNEMEKIQIRKCAAGRAHLIALSDNGIAYSLGNNSYGQCGRPIIQDEIYAENQNVHRIESINGELIENVECGQDHSLFITKSGKVFSCGWGADGQTGLGHYQSIGQPSHVKGDLDGEKIVKLSGSVDCVLALNDKGEVFGWGNAEYGQLDPEGDNQQINSPKYIKSTNGYGKIVDIAAGGSYCLILNEDGDVFVWGYGILGLGPSTDHQAKPKQIPPTLFGRNEFNPMCRITSIYSGISHIAAITDQHDMYVWGRNRFGCLGLGHENDQYFPFKVAIAAKVLKASLGVDHTIALCKAFI